MAFQVKFTATRPDTSVPFWWKSTDPVIVDQQNRIATLAAAADITLTLEEPDELTFVNTFEFETQWRWHNIFMKNLQEAYPGIFVDRAAYYASAGHTLAFVFTDTSTGEVVGAREVTTVEVIVPPEGAATA